MYIRLGLFSLCCFAVANLASGPVHAQDYLEQKMRAADAAFQRNDFEGGANLIRELCYSLKSSPTAAANPVQIASGKVDLIDGKLQTAIANNDSESARRLIKAEETLLNPLSSFDPQNSRWHYQKALLMQMSAGLTAPSGGLEAQMAAHLGIQANLPRQLDMQPLRNAIQECDRVLSMPDQSYRQQALELKAKCQSEMQRRTSNINNMNAEYQRKLPRGIPPANLQNGSPYRPAMQSYCPKCGGFHASGICPNTHGG
jgi:hypothetical protein